MLPLLFSKLSPAKYVDLVIPKKRLSGSLQPCTGLFPDHVQTGLHVKKTPCAILVLGANLNNLAEQA